VGRARQWLFGVSLGAGFLVLLAAVAFSPLALRQATRVKLNWLLVGNAGQAYGAASSILSAMAFFAVAITLAFQIRQNREGRTYAIRELHSSLLRMAMKDQRYLEAWGDFPVPQGMDRDVAVYINMIINYISVLYQTGKSDTDELRAHVRAIFDGAIGRAYWELARHNWLTYSQGREKRLARIIDEEYQRAIASGPPVRPMPSATDSEPPTRQHTNRGGWRVFNCRRRC
jgi:hypothetical protein